MINIIREPSMPESLNTQEVRDYVNNCAIYKDDPENNPKPTISTKYRSSDLIQAFDRCFFSKCYLTEEKFFNSWKMDVDHFVGQNEDMSLIYEWTNLYPAEHKANMCKPRTTPIGGYLDPCNNHHDVENEIIYTLVNFGNKPNFTPRNPHNAQAVNTCILLERIHNGHNTESENNMADLRHGIQKKYIHLLEKICHWRSLEIGSQAEIQVRNELRLMLSRRSSFTMILRSIPPVIQINSDFPTFFFD
ncbi:MAG: hypothetical protein WAT92_11160 [Saprospiraceae bacterium]